MPWQLLMSGSSTPLQRFPFLGNGSILLRSKTSWKPYSNAWGGFPLGQIKKSGRNTARSKGPNFSLPCSDDIGSTRTKDGSTAELLVDGACGSVLCYSQERVGAAWHRHQWSLQRFPLVRDGMDGMLAVSILPSGGRQDRTTSCLDLCIRSRPTQTPRPFLVS